jgi:hypothetical protein
MITFAKSMAFLSISVRTGGVTGFGWWLTMTFKETFGQLLGLG